MIGNISDSLCYIAEAQFVKSTPKGTTVFDTDKIEIRITSHLHSVSFLKIRSWKGRVWMKSKNFPIHLQLKCLRLRTVYTIVEAVQEAGSDRWTLMNYESAEIRCMRKSIIDSLIDIYVAQREQTWNLSYQNKVCRNTLDNISSFSYN